MKTAYPQPHYYSLESDRLRYRPLTEADIDRWAPFFIDNDHLEYVGAHLHPDKDAFQKAHNWIDRQLERMANKKFGQVAVIDKITGEFLGVGGLIEREINGAVAVEVSYSLLQSQWGKGLASELAQCFKAYALEFATEAPIISIIHVDNIGSMRVAEKNGMVRGEEMEFMEMPMYIYRLPV